ncbi:MAG: hypothetical protein NVSMB17_02300 [Candidatus Dormibacteria bacterium]
MTRTGRPPKDGITRKRQFAVRVTPEEEQQILELAAKEDMTASEVIRTALIAAKVIARNPSTLGLAVLPEEATEVKRVVIPRKEGGRAKSGRRTGAAPA